MSGDLKRRLLVDAGRRIREARTEQALSLEQLARLTGISAPALSLIETGKRRPSPNDARKDCCCTPCPP